MNRTKIAAVSASAAVLVASALVPALSANATPPPPATSTLDTNATASTLNADTELASTQASAQPRALQTTTPSSKKLPGTKCRIFPANNYWHADISNLPVHPRSTEWLATTNAADTDLHPDFGPSYGEQPVPYGIPITVVKGKPKKVKVRFGYSDESDRVKYPLNRKTKIEGGANAGGDRHTVVVEAKTCKLYETWDTHKQAGGWYAGSGAVWSLKSNALRPAGWTSADAAGLPILPGLLRWDEVKSGHVDHAIRFTVHRTHNSYLWPARHRAGATNDLAYPPMGARFRLKAGFNTAGYSAQAKVILSAMKRHGLVLADNGSDWYFQGTSDTRWPGDLVDELKRIPAAAFEAVDTAPLQISPNSAKARR